LLEFLNNSNKTREFGLVFFEKNSSESDRRFQTHHENGDSDCLLKTQDSAKFYNDV